MVDRLARTAGGVCSSAGVDDAQVQRGELDAEWKELEARARAQVRGGGGTWRVRGRKAGFAVLAQVRGGGRRHGCGAERKWGRGACLMAVCALLGPRTVWPRVASY